MSDNKPVGRPKQGLGVLWDGWQKSVTDLYANGASDTEIKALIYYNKGHFSEDLWERWLNEEPEFSQTIKNGRLLSKAWWEISGRANLKDKDFSYTGWYMNMKNRFGWRDKTETEHSGSVEVKQVTGIEVK